MGKYTASVPTPSLTTYTHTWHDLPPRLRQVSQFSGPPTPLRLFYTVPYWILFLLHHCPRAHQSRWPGGLKGAMVSRGQS